MISHHVSKRYPRGSSGSVMAPRPFFSNPSQASTSSSGYSTQRTNNSSQYSIEENDPRSLVNRLRLAPNEEPLDLLETRVFQTYIEYAKQNVSPVLTAEACAEIKKFYNGLRHLSNSRDFVPVNIRQLDALIRLSVARARIDLAETVTMEHVYDVFAIYRSCLIDVLNADVGEAAETSIGFGPSRSTIINAAGLSKAKQQQILYTALLKHVKSKKNNFVTNAEIKQIAEDHGIDERNILVDRLNEQGALIKTGIGQYRIILD